MRLLSVPVTLLILLGCAGTFAPVPEEGDYEITVFNGEISAGCDAWGVEESADEATDVVAVQVSDDEILFVGWFPCDREFASFECLYLDRTESSGVTVETRTDGQGEWTAKQAFEASFDTILSCEGSGCGDLADEPCTLSYDWEGVLVE